MTEVRLPAPVQATLDKRLAEGSWAEGTKFKPGAFAVAERGEPPRLYLSYACPCGCGSVGSLPIRSTAAGAPEQHPSWAWNADVERPTLVPSIHDVGHWHGYLRDGAWVDA